MALSDIAIYLRDLHHVLSKINNKKGEPMARLVITSTCDQRVPALRKAAGV